MASNGSVAEASKREAGRSCAGSSVSPRPVAPKPVIARKPQPPGGRPCPPIPKKPPVAHKPPSPRSVLSQQGSPAASSSPESHAVNKTPGTGSQGAGTLTTAPPAEPCSAAQGTAPSARRPSPHADSKPVSKTSPPPLPRTPPRGTQSAGTCATKDPPPRPSHLPGTRKPPPPVPAKKPAVRKNAVSRNIGKDSSHETSLSHSHQQAAVRDNTETDRATRQTEDSVPPSCESEVTSIPRANPYELMVAEENINDCGKGSVDVSQGKDRLLQTLQPKSSENVQLKPGSQNPTPSDPFHSYEQVVVEENAVCESNVGANTLCKLNLEKFEACDNSHGEQKIPLSDAGDRVQSIKSPEPKDTAKIQTTDNQVGSELIRHRRASVEEEPSSHAMKEQSANAVSEEAKVSDKFQENPELVPRVSPKGSLRPPALPPVRPKPKKRVSLLRQVQVTDEDSAQEIQFSSPADAADSDSSLPNSTADSSVEKVVCQEIHDDLDAPDNSPDENKSFSNGAHKKTPDTDSIISIPKSVKDECSVSCSDAGTEVSKPSELNINRDNASNACSEDISTEVEDQCKASAVSESKGIEENSHVVEVISPHSTEEPENTDPKTLNENTGKSPENTDPKTMNENTGKSPENTDPKTMNENTGKSPENTDPKTLNENTGESPEKQSVSLQDVGETSFMLKEIEQLLKERLGSAQTETEAETESSKTSNVLASSQSVDSPVRPPRPKRADKLRKLTTLGCSSADSSSTESLTSVDLSGKKAPPKPRRKNLPGSVNRSLSDVTGVQTYLNQLKSKEEEEEKPFLPPRQHSLRLSLGGVPPPLPPRNKSMEQVADGGQKDPKPKEQEVKNKEEEQPSSTVERQGSVSNVVTISVPNNMVRSSTSVKSGKKHMPRPTRKAPPPPPHPPNHSPPSAAVQGSGEEPSSSVGEKVPGYQKISNGLTTSGDDINTVVPKSAVVGNIDSPSAADVSSDHDYHEIPDHLVKDLCEPEEEPPAEKSKETTPPPVLPPRSYKVPPQTPTATVGQGQPSDSSKSTVLNKNADSKTERCAEEAESSQNLGVESEETSQTGDHRLSAYLSAEDSTLSSPQSSRPESFCSEVLGSLAHVVGDHLRPISTHSSSSHSETGSGEMEVPTFDNSSGSESENEEDEDRMKQKREKKVFFIAEEVVKSEEVFVDVLKLLNVDFRVFMSTKTEQAGHTIVPTETLNKILDFLPQLQSFNEMLLKDLTDRIANWDKQKKIADIFVKKGPFLKLYSSYIRNFEHATALLDETCKKHGGFGMALQQFELSPRCASLALKHYMLKPIQRIPQYKLLLQDYLKHLTPDCPDYKDTITALNIVSEVADHANESMRHGDNVHKLLEIQRSLIGQFEVIQPGRVLIKQGELMKMSRKEKQPRMFFLFSDVLLYTTPVPTGYRLNNILPLQGMKVLPPKLEEFNNEFNIITTQRSFTVATSTPEEREEWLRALWNAIEENSERYHTFKSMQSEPKTSLLDKDFVLGTKAPLWVPDARVTMCMLCLAEFSITWRRHHCRACGRIICGNCSENKAPLQYLMYKPARVCEECFNKLSEEVDKSLEKEKKPVGDKDESSTTQTPPGGATPSASSATTATPTSYDTSGLSFSSIKARFQKIRKSARERRKSGLARPSVLKEVHANDEGSNMSGYLWVAKNKKWKRLWFVVKGKVLYTYKASEDMAAIESMPLLGFEVTRMTSWYQGAEPDLMFELHHQNTQPLIFKSRKPSVSSGSGGGGDRNSVIPLEDSQSLSVSSCSGGGGDRNLVIPLEDSQSLSVSSPSLTVKSSADTTTPRLVFRTDSAAATTKWVTVLREASLA